MLYPKFVTTNTRYRGPLESEKSKAHMYNSKYNINLIKNCLSKYENIASSISTTDVDKMNKIDKIDKALR